MLDFLSHSLMNVMGRHIEHVRMRRVAAFALALTAGLVVMVFSLIGSIA